MFSIESTFYVFECEQAEEDIRSCCIRLAMACLVSADNKVIKQMLANKGTKSSLWLEFEFSVASPCSTEVQLSVNIEC